MDFKVLFGTFALIFLAEMGDKTQLAIFGSTVASRRPFEVFLGATVALVAVTALAVLVGRFAGHLIPVKALRAIGGVVFIAIGVYLLLKPHA